jgi:lipopolysaccharide transport protein LptA
VILQQGTMRIQAQTVDTVVDPEGYQLATAKGGANGLVQFEQKRDGTNETMKAQAEQLIYDGKNNVIVLAKRARAQRVDAQGKIIDQIEADELTYNQLTEVFETNLKGTGRTHVLITPRNQNNPSNPKGAK